MVFHLSNFSPGWNERLMEVLVRARSGDTIVVPTPEIARDARIFYWAASVIGDVHIMTREEYAAQKPTKEGEYEQRDTVRSS